jgi:hypothetical protein
MSIQQDLSTSKPSNDQGSFELEPLKKVELDALKPEDDSLHASIPSQIQQELFADEGSVISAPPDYVSSHL